MLAPKQNQQIEVKLFIDAIETAGLYTRAIHTITRTYGATVAQPGAATLVLVNAGGWALTCRHVAQQLMATDEVNSRYARFKQELAAKPDKKSQKAHQKALQREYGYRSDTVVEVRHMLVNCGDFKGFEIKLHPTMDMALIRFNEFRELPGTQYPVFAASGADLKPGMSLCRLGFPFPEFQNFEYDPEQDTITWTQSGRQDSCASSKPRRLHNC